MEQFNIDFLCSIHPQFVASWKALLKFFPLLCLTPYIFPQPDEERKIRYCSSTVQMLAWFMGMLLSTQRCEEFSPSNISVLAEVLLQRSL